MEEVVQERYIRSGQKLQSMKDEHELMEVKFLDGCLALWSRW